MKFHNFTILLTSLAFVAVALPANAQTVKIGLVDVQRAVITVKDGVAVKGKLERLLKQKQNEFDKMQEDVKKLKDELETQMSTMREELRRQKMQE